MKPPILACLTLALTPLLSATESHSERWFPWPSVEPADGSALDVSSQNVKPAGSRGQITVKDGQFRLPDGTRVRFWGSNFQGVENYPTHADADAFARMLAKSGVNIARLHHLDNPWGVGNGGSIWPTDTKKHEALDPVQLEKLQYLVFALAREGIYSNYNLKVSKQLAAEDGFPLSVAQVANFQKRVDIYHRRMIDLQKDYARRLLTAVNPYTGKAPVNDPVVATIEINNENSLLGYWTTNLGQGLDKFPPEFHGELLALWNHWLLKKYSTDADLAKAWQVSKGTAGAVLIDVKTPWVKSETAGSALTLNTAPSGEFSANVTQSDGIDWHAQVSADGLALVDGEAYTVEFEAKSEAPREIRILLGLDAAASPGEPWRELGFSEGVAMVPEWKLFRKSFIAHSVGQGKGRLDLNLGQRNGAIAFRNFKVKAGVSGGGLQSGQSAEKGSVSFPVDATSVQWADWIHFLADTERAFADEMRHYIRDELGALAPIVVSQIDYGALTGVNREIGSDFADGHSYWEHPDFGASNDWDANRWSITNSAMIAGLGPKNFQRLGELALYRIAGKPYTISEYDHPAPSEFTSEMYPLVSAFASVQDWDGIYPFALGTYGHADKDGRISSYFDQQHNPSKWSQSAFATRVFRGGLVKPASAQKILHLGSPLWAESHHAPLLWSHYGPAEGPGFLNSRIAISEKAGAVGAKASVESRGTVEDGQVSLQETPAGKVVTVHAPAAAAVIGFLGNQPLSAGVLHVQARPFGRGFGSVTALALDGQELSRSKRILVTIVARSQNQGMVWNASRTSVGTQWGHGPVEAEFVPAVVTLNLSRGVAVYPLNPDGTRRAALSSVTRAGAIQFDTADGEPTLHYELVAE